MAAVHQKNPAARMKEYSVTYVDITGITNRQRQIIAEALRQAPKELLRAVPNLEEAEVRELTALLYPPQVDEPPTPIIAPRPVRDSPQA